MSLQQRRDEILAKRAKLAELKRTREQRDRERAQRELSGHGTPEVTGPGTRTGPESREALESLINSLVDRPDSGRNSRSGSPAAKASRPSSLFGTGQLGVGHISDTSPRGTPSRPVSIQTASIATQTLSASAVATNYEVNPAIPVRRPPEVVSYSVGVQTAEPWSPPKRKDSVDGISDSEDEASASTTRSPKAQKRLSRRERDREDELRQNIKRELAEELRALKDPAADGVMTNGTSNRFPVRALTTEEVNALTSSPEFLDSVDRSIKVIERALESEYDVLVDYGLEGADGLDSDDDEGYGSMRGKKGRKIKEVAQFYDEKWSKKRMISDVNFSPKFPELVLASYTKNPSAPQDPSGLLQVWNLHLQSRPEYTFHSSSDILTAKFSPFHPSLIIGGTYSGQVLLWDTRSRSSLPVQKTPLTGASAGGHTHPIYSIDLIGTQNANNIISCSTDGVICGWSIDMLSQPQEYLELTTPPPSKTEDMSPTCLAFPPSDPTSFLVGTEEGTIYPCHRYDRAGAKAGVDNRVRYKGHAAPVMSINFHSARGPMDLSDLVLTSSLDWTVKLWKIRPPSSVSTTTASTNFPSALPGSGNSNAQEIVPVMELAREDVVYDARWSPQRPSVFALVDGTGNVEVWDLLIDTEVPVARASPEPNKKVVGTAAAYAPKSLNKVSWDEKDGKRIAVGGASGMVTVFEVGSLLSAEGGIKGDEWARVKKMVARMERGGR